MAITALLADWMNSKRASSSSSQSVFMTLLMLQRRYNLLKVRREYDREEYQSMILEVDIIRRRVIIDELFPSGKSITVIPGQTLKITSRQRHGVTLGFSSKVIEISERDGLPVYVIEMPKQIQSEQRRKAYRVPVDQSTGLGVELPGPNQQRVSCTPVDISVSGMRVQTLGDLTKFLRRHPVLPGCQINVENQGSVRCTLDVRNARYEETSGEHTIIGGRFLGLSYSDKRLMEQTLASIQRQQQRLRSESD